MYHSHHDEMTQMGMGLIGMFVIHPRNPAPEYRVDRDFALMLSEWAIEPGTARPNTLEMTDFNVLTMNGKVFPGDRRRWCARPATGCASVSATWARWTTTRSTSTGYHFRITATDGEDIPLSAQWPETTVLVAVGQTRTIEFVADAPGDWALPLPHDPPRHEPDGPRVPEHGGREARGPRREGPAAAAGAT